MKRSEPRARLRAALLAWYDDNKRELPWRGSRDPYAIWVSEVMLQQTRVETVKPYYRRFLERFPDLASLASADEDAVLSMWSGLGYYRRARMLHRGVREAVERYGRVPEGADERRSLPGVGRYTAGAIGSIAFGREEAVVDGNVARVLARHEGIDTPIGKAVTERALWAEAEALVRGPRPGDLNQALMELGARVCTPKAWRCGECPIAAGCVAHSSQRVAELPVPRARKAPLEVAMVLVVASRADGRVALSRGRSSLFGGLWGLPSGEGHGRPCARAALRASGVSARLAHSTSGQLDHVLSHRRLQVEVWSASAARVRAPAELVSPTELKERGVSRLTHRALESARTQA